MGKRTVNEKSKKTPGKYPGAEPAEGGERR